MTDSSRLWEELIQQEFSTIDSEFLNSFRAPGSSNRFVAWDPYEPSARYLKFLLFTVAQRQSAGFLDAYRRIGHCDLGNPLSIRYSDCEINADYLAAVEEWQFLGDSGGLAGAGSIVEIGAGFGRTCHTIMTLAPWIGEYTIIDLDPMLALSRSYLKQVAPETFDRLRFVSSKDKNSQNALTPDLVINIDSFQEMPLATVDDYMQRVVSKASRFYCKNAVGKYLPATVGLRDSATAERLDVLSLGYCRNVIDVFNDKDLQAARANYLDAYRPPSDRGLYQVASSKVMDLFPYFHHALYLRAA